MSADAQILRAVEQFLFLEAEYMDQHAYDKWLALWHEDVLYWVPCNADDSDPRTQISLIYDRRPQIEQRISRLKGEHAHAQHPRSKLMRVVSNVQIRDCTETQVIAASAFVLGEVRLNAEVTWIGRTLHTLSRHPEGFRMKEKKVTLLNNDAPIGNLQFLI